jgi:tRNA uracil 4-sulfurtransferase
MKAVCLVSSGIDSPVAAYLMAPYVKEMIFLHVDTGRFSSADHTSMFYSLVHHMRNIVSCRIRAGVLSHERALEAFPVYRDRKHICVFCKRMMVRYAEGVALQMDADMIVMGDSLGQVASQTLQNIRVVDTVSSVPIIRPLIGLDKQDIIDIAKDIGTFDLSIKDTSKCLAVPLKPSTNAQDEALLDIEQDIDVSFLVEQVISGVKWLEFS